jgi:hypothetical protein
MNEDKQAWRWLIAGLMAATFAESACAALSEPLSKLAAQHRDACVVLRAVDAECAADRLRGELCRMTTDALPACAVTAPMEGTVQP